MEPEWSRSPPTTGRSVFVLFDIPAYLILETDGIGEMFWCLCLQQNWNDLDMKGTVFINFPRMRRLVLALKNTNMREFAQP